MAFTKADSEYIRYNVWGDYGTQLETPCNVYFAGSVDCKEIKTIAHLEALMSKIRRFARDDGAPACGFSVTEKEFGWKVIVQYIANHPQKFQTITTPSRHGEYKVMWVFFRTNGRKF